MTAASKKPRRPTPYRRAARLVKEMVDQDADVHDALEVCGRVMTHTMAQSHADHRAEIMALWFATLAAAIRYTDAL